MKKLIQKQSIQLSDTCSHTVASELDYLCYRIVAYGSIYCFLPVFNELCQEHEFLLVVSHVMVM